MKSLRFAAFAALLAFGSPGHAGIYTDDLSRCLVDKTTTEDKTAFVQWIFVAMSQHPSVASMTKITAADVTHHNQVAGALVMKLLTETCVEHFKKAMKYEGAMALQTSFSVLGQAAAGELFAHPDVLKVMSGLDQYLDGEKLRALSK
jgi:hypothetical protein